MEPSPSPNGRLNNGRFGIGNSGGPGNPLASQVAKLRSALLDVVTKDDVKAIIKMLIDKAKSGDLAAAKLLLDRTCGKSFVDRLPSPKTSTSGLRLSVDERRSRVAEICRTAVARSGTGGQTEQHETEHEVDSDADKAESLTTSTAVVG